jgi:hypothetical protein
MLISCGAYEELVISHQERLDRESIAFQRQQKEQRQEKFNVWIKQIDKELTTDELIALQAAVDTLIDKRKGSRIEESVKDVKETTVLKTWIGW